LRSRHRQRAAVELGPESDRYDIDVANQVSVADGAVQGQPLVNSRTAPKITGLQSTVVGEIAVRGRRGHARSAL
jgi:hypothetical protein